MSERKRTRIKNLPQPAKDLTPTEEKQIRGGVGLPEGNQRTKATRLSIVATSGGADSKFDEDQTENE
ncbi:MAG TPA: hypothetical protein VFD58_31920 [Blastocatellia bacterium]|nr:hypothetical protein [Blastocatellia bacterium]